MTTVVEISDQTFVVIEEETTVLVAEAKQGPMGPPGVIPTETLETIEARLIALEEGGTGGSGSFDVTRLRIREKPTGIMNGTNKNFTLAEMPVAGTESVYLNGLLVESGDTADYTLVGQALRLAAAPATTERLVVSYVIDVDYVPPPPPDEGDTGAGTGISSPQAAVTLGTVNFDMSITGASSAGVTTGAGSASFAF